MKENKPKRKRIEPIDLLKRRGVVTESEVVEWLREGRLYVYRDERGRPVAFYLDHELWPSTPWWVEDRRLEPRRRQLIEEIRRREGQATTS